MSGSHWVPRCKLHMRTRLCPFFLPLERYINPTRFRYFLPFNLSTKSATSQTMVQNVTWEASIKFKIMAFSHNGESDDHFSENSTRFSWVRTHEFVLHGRSNCTKNITHPSFQTLFLYYTSLVWLSKTFNKMRRVQRDSKTLGVRGDD